MHRLKDTSDYKIIVIFLHECLKKKKKCILFLASKDPKRNWTVSQEKEQE